MTESIPLPPQAPLAPQSVELITCDLCGNEFSYDPNAVLVVQNAAAKCPKCSYNQTTISKPRLKDIVMFGTPVVVVYAITIAILLINR